LSNSYKLKKEAKAQAKAAKKEKRQEEKKYKKRREGWAKVTCAAICGCCEAVFYFENREKAEQVCKEATNKHITITDDEGTTEEVDGFYGFNIEDI
jgi:cell division septal protein FtsQ